MTHQQALELVTRIPRSANEIYREEIAGLAADVRLTVSHRNRRRELGRLLGQLAREGLIARGVIEGEGHRPWVCFWTLDSRPGAGDVG